MGLNAGKLGPDHLEKLKRETNFLSPEHIAELFEYVKPMPGLELDVVISFSDNALPKENNEVELYDLLFRTKTSREMSLEKVPPVLLSEMVRTLETLTGKAK